MIFIEVTQCFSGKTVYINPNYISAITTDQNGTVIRILDGRLYFNVRESVEEILNIINK